MLNTHLSIPPGSGAAPPGERREPCAGICYFGLERVLWCRVKRILTLVSSLFSAFSSDHKTTIKSNIFMVSSAKNKRKLICLRLLQDSNTLARARAHTHTHTLEGCNMSAADSFDER